MSDMKCPKCGCTNINECVECGSRICIACWFQGDTSEFKKGAEEP